MNSSSKTGAPKPRLEVLEDRQVPDATSFVTGLYANLLNRAPDAAGLNAWIGALRAGASNQQVATAIWDSPEHRAVEVTGYYETLLNRAPDAAGLGGWVNLMVSGVLNEQGVEAAFLTSGEFINNHPTPALYITALYQRLLARLPTLGEINIWIPTLQINGPVFVSEAIITSTERFVDVVDFYYLTFLRRNADTAGLVGWVNALQTNQATVESVGEAILGSAEYASKH